MADSVRVQFSASMQLRRDLNCDSSLKHLGTTRWWQAFIDIRNDHTCRRAVEQSDEASGQTEHCIARAVAALAAIYASDVGLPALTAEQRDALVADMFAELRPSDYRGVTAWAKSTLSSLGLRILTRRLSDRKRH